MKVSSTLYITLLVHFKKDRDTGCVPRQAVPPDKIELGDKPTAILLVLADNPWRPFMSRYDWNLASWFARARCSKHSIKEYLKDEEFATAGQGQKGAIASYRDLMRAMYAIPYGILGGDGWLERDIVV